MAVWQNVKQTKWHVGKMENRLKGSLVKWKLE